MAGDAVIGIIGTEVIEDTGDATVLSADRPAVHRHLMPRLAAHDGDVWVGANPSGTLLYVGTVAELVEMFGETPDAFTPVARYEAFNASHITWKVEVN